MKRRVLTPEEMRRSDKLTMQEKNKSESDLMADAVGAIHDLMVTEGLLENKKRAVVVSGGGNNGSDGFGIARRLLADGLEVDTFLVGDEDRLRGAAKAMFTALEQETAALHTIRSATDTSRLEESLAACDIVIDALFGIGLEGAVQGLAACVIDCLNATDAPVIAIDIPSGLNAYNGLVEGKAVRAAHTIVVQALKTGNLLADAADHHGAIHVADAGILIDDTASPRYLIEDDTFAGILPPRKKNTHKYDYGNVLVIGGKRSMEGAALLSAEAALRSGAGLVRVLSPSAAEPARILCPPEIMRNDYTEKEDALVHLDKATAAAFGMGLGRDDPLDAEILEALIAKQIPAVVDADGLHVLKGILKAAPALEHIVLTPHVGELAALHDTTATAVMKDPFYHTTSLVSRFGATVVLKGPVTLIATDDGQYFSSLGTPGMATAGSGDVLSGIIARFLGQRAETSLAALHGVYAHGLAGSMAEAAFGEEGMVATDIIAFLPEALARMKGWMVS